MVMGWKRRHLAGVVALALTAIGAQLASGQEETVDELHQEVRELRARIELRDGRYEAKLRKINEALERIESMRATEGATDDVHELQALREAANEEAGQDDQEGSLFDKLLEQLGVRQQANAFNPRVTAFGDFLGAAASKKTHDGNGNEVGSRLWLREFELDMRADVDPYAKGVLIVSWGEEEPNTYEAAVEEGYITLHDLPWGLEDHGLQLQVGRFRLGFGQINKLHRHDLPQVNYPLAVEEFFGEEGASGNGLNLSWLVPNPFDEAVQLDVTATNGDIGPIFDDGSRHDGAAFGRLKWFKDLGGASFLEMGVSHLVGRPGDPSSRTQLTGVDFLWKWRPDEASDNTSLVFQSELFFLNRRVAGQGDVDSIGGYGYLQYQASQRLYLGVRGDYTQLADDEHHANKAASGYVSFYTTEFLRVRVGYEHRWDDVADRQVDTAMLQFTWVFGSHPVEPYWVNR